MKTTRKEIPEAKFSTVNLNWAEAHVLKRALAAYEKKLNRDLDLALDDADIVRIQEEISVLRPLITRVTF